MNKDPGLHSGNKKRHTRASGVAAATLLALVAACTTGGGSAEPKPTTPSTASASAAPESTTTTLNPETLANQHNKEVAEKVLASAESRMGDLPERILAYAKRRGYGIDIYETGGNATTRTPEENIDGLNSLTVGTEQNILVESYKAIKAGDATVESNFLLRWNILPDGSRKLVTLDFFQYDYTDETSFNDPQQHGFRTLDTISITRAEDGSYNADYTDVATGRTAGMSTSMGSNGKPTTVDPAMVESKLAGFDTILAQ